MVSLSSQKSSGFQKMQSVDIPLQMKDVLVVGDSKTMRNMVVSTINCYKDFNIIEAENGTDAFEKIKKNMVKLIFFDFDVSRMNGIEFFSKMRAMPQYKTTPVIMLTSESEDANVRQGYLAGATVCVTKPFQADNLLKIVEAMRFWHVK